MTTETTPASGADIADKPSAPPYISFLTFLNLLEWLEKEGVPHRFDRSFWSRKYAGNVGPYLVNGLRFLKLLQGDSPQPALEKLVQAKAEDRKAALRDVLKQAYAEVNFELLPKATPG